MEPKFKTSFIPKAPIQTSQGKAGSGRKDGVNFFMLIAVILFLVAALLGGGVFAYKLTLKGTIESQLKTLDQARSAFEPKFISEATRLNSRIVNANRLLNNHLAPSEIFHLLEDFTLQTVSFNKFEFEDGEDGTIKILASGEGDSFRSIVLQSDKFGESGYMRDVLFSDLEPNEFGNVNFTMEGSIDPRLVLYRRSLEPVGNTGRNNENTQQENGSQNTNNNQEEVDNLGIFGN